jgi:uncharacterized protein (TIGR02996 family)
MSDTDKRLAELLSKVCNDPDDLETRLVYADLLSELGDPRGAYIAQHCQLEQLDALEAGYAALAASTRRLEARHAPGWLADYLELAEVAGAGSGRAPLDRLFNAEFRRGFLHRVAMTPQDIERHWDWLRAREPLQGIELRVDEHLPAPFHRLEQPRSFRALKVRPDSWFTDNSVGDVLRWDMRELRELDLSGCAMGLAGAQMLCNLPTDLGQTWEDWTAPPPLPEGQLRSLVLHGTGIGDAPARLLLGAATMCALEVLELSQCKLEERATLEALGAAELPQLRSLSLAGNKALGGQLDALSGWSGRSTLERLALPLTTTPDDLAALFPRPSSALRALTVSSAKQAAAEPQRLAACAEALTELDIGTTRIGDAKLATLLAQPSLTSLHTLRINGCSLSDKGLDQLIASPLDRLLTLDISSNKLTDDGVARLAAWPGLAHLTQLRLGNNRKLGAAGYQALIEAPQLQPTVLDIGKAGDGPIVETLRERFGAALHIAG